MFVVVTVASNGVVHAWGEGPVVGGEVTPFATRNRASTVAKRFKREHARQAEMGETRTVEVRVRQILGTEPVSS
jgi:hypothetical protein